MSTVLDFSVLRVIKEGKHRFKDILEVSNVQERQLDRALQRLRTRGLVSFKSSTGWTATQTDAPAHA